MDETFLTIPEVAKLLRLSERSVYNLAQRGELPGAVKFGRQWRVSRDKLLEGVETKEKVRGTGEGEQEL